MTSIGVEMGGMKELLAQIGAATGKADAVVLAVVTKMTTDTRNNAVRGIQRGPKSGDTYEGKAPKRTHKASAPGQYPASDTGRLASSVNMVLPTPGSPVGFVGTDVQYGPWLEFGTSKMAARPWLLPSFNKARATVETELKRKWEAKGNGI